MANVSFNIGNFINPVNGAANQGANGGKSVSAGNTQMMAPKNNPLIAQKKQLAGKQAMKLITDAFARDKEHADSLEGLKAKHAEIKQQYSENVSKLKAMDDEMNALKEEYGVDPDSEEQKDLDLLKKYQDAKNGVKYSSFTPEEKARLKELEGTGRTEYQSRALALNKEYGYLQKETDGLEKALMSYTSSINDMETDHLKTQDMIKAGEAADKIMEAASKEAVGMLINDAKEAVEEKQEEEKKKGEKLAKEREKFEERLEESRERRKEEQEIIENANKAEIKKTDIDVKTSDDTAVAKAQKDIQKILTDNNLLDEDIKGLKINLGF